MMNFHPAFFSYLHFIYFQGITDPMLYIGMLFSMFAWHVEDHYLYRCMIYGIFFPYRHLSLEGGTVHLYHQASQCRGVLSYMSLKRADGIDKVHISSGGINENIPTIFLSLFFA